jgi:SRSO17 transposase
MPLPIICANQALCQFVAAFAEHFSKPQRKYFVTVLLALMLCQERRTLTALLRRILDARSLSGLSRFFARAPWSEEEVAQTWRERFDAQVRPLVIFAHRSQEAKRPKKPGRPKATVVTGYLLLDDSTHPKRKGRKMEGVGKHYSSTQKGQVLGHSLFQALYVLEGRQCPLPPKMYCTKSVCEKEKKPFQSKIEMAVNTVRDFIAVEQTQTHVLADSWFACGKLWKACRKRGFAISGGLKCNRNMRTLDAEGKVVYVRLSEYAASLTPDQFTECVWPSAAGGNPVFVHRVRTLVRKLGACQVLIVRPSADASLKQTRYFVSSLLEADTPTLLEILAIRWKIETFFDDLKELFGSDHYQMMSRASILRFWTLACCAYMFLEEQRAERGMAGSSIGTIRRQIEKEHQSHLLEWLCQSFQSGSIPKEMKERLAA